MMHSAFLLVALQLSTLRYLFFETMAYFAFLLVTLVVIETCMHYSYHSLIF